MSASSRTSSCECIDLRCTVLKRAGHLSHSAAVAALDVAPSSRISHAATAIIGSDTARMIAATALTSGSVEVFRRLPRIHSGSVVVSDPARKKVTAISSNDSANDSSAPATSAVRIVGTVTYRKVCQPLAPRSCEAHVSDSDTRRRRASTLLKTSTMQNVVWPMITVRIDSGVFVNRKNDASATPVITPGRMIGRITAKLTASRPGKRKRAKAKARAVPSTSAIAVAIAAIRTDSHSASFGVASWKAVSNHFVEKPGKGHELMFVLLNA